jgi:hypothetical protein
MGTRKFRTASRDSALEAAKQLMAEREKYEQWLEDLEAKKDSTPAKVFDRVRQDYLARLQTVMDQLGQHTSALQDHAESLMEKLRELEEAEEENTEAQEEAAIRKQVGEITSAEWESGSRKAQRELAKIKENQTVILADLNRIRGLVDSEDEDEEEEPEKRKPPAKSSKEFNELEFLTKVVGESAPTPEVLKQRTTPSGVPVSRPSPPSAPKQETRASPPAVTSVPTPSAAVQATPPDEPKATPSSATQTPANEGPNQPRQSMMAEQPKTLKCQECGTMNYPSEWYCERCGAELTVV